MTSRERLELLIAQSDVLLACETTCDSPEFEIWKFNVERFLVRFYGKSSHEYQSFSEISFKFDAQSFFSYNTVQDDRIFELVEKQAVLDCQAGIEKAKKILLSIQQDFADDDKTRGGIVKYDVFISHANKDKSEYVEALKKSLEKLRIQIFYDKDSLEWGDLWKDRILSGAKEAEFAIIVISENFFDREWTERELSEFLARQNDCGQKIVLPIMHNISAEQLSNKYPSVADIQALKSSEYSTDEIALQFAAQLIKRLRSK